MKNKLEEAFLAENFREQGHQLVEMMADYLTDITRSKQEGKTISWQQPEDQLEYWEKDFYKPTLANPLDLFEDVLNRSVQVHRKQYLGHQTTPTLPVTFFSGAMISMLNQGMGVYEMGMVGNTLEKILTESLAKTLGFDERASGFITSGGSLGNLTGLLAARAAATDIWRKGSSEGLKPAVLVSEEAHYCIDRAARIMGLGDEGIIKIPVNENFQMRVDLLEQYYDQANLNGQQVICVVGCAATTSTGSYDDLKAIARFCQKKEVWFHVDGAHGAPAAFSPQYKYLVKGIEQADSVVVDYHKMMMTPSLSTALIFKQGKSAYKTFSQRAQYLWSEQETEEWYNGGKRSFECTKAMSALHVYTLYRTYGETIFAENIEKLFGMAGEFATLIKQNSNFELAYEPQCNIVCFRYSKGNNDLTELNTKIRQKLLEEGKYYIVQTVLKGHLYLRVSLMNPLTSVRELIELLQEIEEKASFFLNRSNQ